jgi:hypothetical protein
VSLQSSRDNSSNRLKRRQEDTSAALAKFTLPAGKVHLLCWQSSPQSGIHEWRMTAGGRSDSGSIAGAPSGRRRLAQRENSTVQW